MKVEPVYTGFAPLASCHWQGLANVLESQGFGRARQKVCLTWGFSWDGEGALLGNSGCWLEAFNATFAGELAREDFGSWSRADSRERELVAARLPFVAEIDAFEVPSEYAQREHVSHTVVVLERDEESAVLLDTMNCPTPRRYPLSRYVRMRTHRCVDRFHLYVSARPPGRDLAADELLAAVLGRFRATWPADARLLGRYAERAREAGVSGLDVCRVGAERLQLAATMSLLAEAEPSLREVSRGLSSLSKRWYLLHTLAEQQAESHRQGRDRILRLLADVQQREVELAESFQETALRAPAL